MIKYKLKCKSTYCTEQNEFDGWFQNIEAFEKQMSLGLIIVQYVAVIISLNYWRHRM